MHEMDIQREELARRIYQTAHLTGTFLLRSGVTSHQYFDKYLLEANPVLLKDIATAMVPLVPEGIDALAGLEMGGIPLATMLSQLTGLPTLFVRKEAKTYGTCKLAEGEPFEGRRLLVVEDVVTSGGAILDATAELRKGGALIEQVVCVIDRESGGLEKLAAQSLALKSLYRMTELEAAAGVSRS